MPRVLLVINNLNNLVLEREEKKENCFYWHNNKIQKYRHRKKIKIPVFCHKDFSSAQCQAATLIINDFYTQLLRGLGLSTSSCLTVECKDNLL